MNFTKNDSLYKQGMRISIFSKKKSELAKNGKIPYIFAKWHRGGDNISYNVSRLSYDNGCKSKIRYYRLIADSNKKIFYNLFIAYNFEYMEDLVYFAYSVPYTYTKLTNLLIELKDKCNKNPNICYRQETLCRSLGGIDIPILTIGCCENANDKSIKKPVSIVTGRIHPGETCGSFMMEGFLRYITSSSFAATQLRRNVIFKIIPMLNIDGVIVGNYRSGLSGQDLNRQFTKPDSIIHPEICSIKKLIRKIREQNQSIINYLDFHAHSKKKCVFIYGPYYPLHSEKYIKVRVFAKLLSENMEMFRYKACKFREEKEKRNAARLVISKEFNILNSFTIEASFHAFIDDDRKSIEFSIELYQMVGKCILDSLLDYFRLIKENKLNKNPQLHLKKTERIKHPKENKGLKNIKSKYQLDPFVKKSQAKIILRANSKSPTRTEHPLPIKVISLNDIYQCIKEERNLEEEPDSNDSDSADSDDDFLIKEEAKTMKYIMKVIKGFYNIKNIYHENIMKKHIKDSILKNDMVSARIVKKYELLSRVIEGKCMKRNIKLDIKEKPKTFEKNKYILTKHEKNSSNFPFHKEKYGKTICYKELLPFNDRYKGRNNLPVSSAKKFNATSLINLVDYSILPKDPLCKKEEFNVKNKPKNAFGINYWKNLNSTRDLKIPIPSDRINSERNIKNITDILKVTPRRAKQK